jgi:hypothetical protein
MRLKTQSAVGTAPPKRNHAPYCQLVGPLRSRHDNVLALGGRASMRPVCRTINLICALALIVVGAYFFVDLPLYALHPKGIIFVAAGAATATFLGLYFLIRGRRNRAAP